MIERGINIIIHTQDIIFPLIIIWGLFTVLNLFHSGIAWIWRISMLLIFTGFTAIHYPLLQKEFLDWQIHYWEKFKNLLISFYSIANIVIYALWVFIPIRIFFSAKEKESENILKYLIIITLFFWLLQLVYPEFHFSFLEELFSSK